jgi:hypothetical protein
MAHARPFDRYADLFTEDEKCARQREVQQRRREWRNLQEETQRHSKPEMLVQ